ncbi:dicarboxylate/amino acid:cation symporter [Chitinophaga pendula]|uniref:dicarboxylate/amino acid:cation symporter n=1 Tax=Chitinophaga TaxID=79328 RepID=UPI000BB0C8BB|nr:MULTISPECIES: dicarboxylate/amino acid:cation symporter [Chitinophaga]ASZ13385.1 sodium:proton antiporter [Chitinophaga sp. MD30]UCJ08993.1 dicarboxylate/amino acid:cation symporter [Chitinophaga pendula]
MNAFLKSYGEILSLLGGILVGSIAGLTLGDRVTVLKPVGDIFLNLLFTAVIPLVFFAISSALANVDRNQQVGKVISIMFLVFVGTLLIAAFLTIVAVWIFPIHQALGPADPKLAIHELKSGNIGEQLTQLLTTGEFYELLSRRNMLPFIIFSVILGFAVMRAGKAGEPIRQFLNGGNAVMTQLLLVIMKLAPIGLGAYFAYQVGMVGPQLFGTYAKSLGIYYGFGVFYYLVMFSVYAFIAAGVPGVKRYWKNNIVPSLTAISTCSSIATIPANIEAARKMGVPDHIGSVVVPLGGTLHKDGSSISSIIKIAVVFAMFGKGFNSVEAVLLAMGISVIVSTVEGGIPNGGYVGELLVMSVYGFPVEALPAVMIIGTLVDPLATVINATGDTVCAMMVHRFMGGSKTPPPPIATAA